MKYNGKNNPRVIIIQKIYSKLINNDLDLNFPKHRFKKFIKDIVNGTLERNEVINNEINLHLKEDIDLIEELTRIKGYDKVPLINPEKENIKDDVNGTGVGCLPKNGIM